MYSLTNQMRRASVSIPTNIAEGCGRESRRELARFLQFSIGSASELEYQVMVSFDLGFLDESTPDRLLETIIEVKRMLVSFHKIVRSDRTR
jgi:four helix bundle protein